MSLFVKICPDLSGYVIICHDISINNCPPVLSVFQYSQLFCSVDSHSVLLIAILFYRKPFCSIDSHSVPSIAILFYGQLFLSIDTILIYRQPLCSIDSHSVLSRATLFCWYLIYSIEKLPLKKRVNCDKCRFVAKQLCWGLSMRSFAIDEAPSPLRTLSATLISALNFG